MTKEVKMVYADIESQLTLMENALQTLQPRANEQIQGNTLNVVTKLMGLTSQLEQLLITYQGILQQSIETTKNSVEFMRETDEKVSVGMQNVR